MSNLNGRINKLEKQANPAGPMKINVRLVEDSELEGKPAREVMPDGRVIIRVHGPDLPLSYVNKSV